MKKGIGRGPWLIKVLLAGLLLAFSWLSATPVLAQSVGISQSSGPPGTSVTISGSGFVDGDTYQITFAPATIYEQLLAATTIISGTTFSRTVAIPSAPWGQYTIAITTSRGNFSVSFQINPRIQLNTTVGNAGATISSSGQGFRAGATVNIVFNSTTIASTQTDSYGILSPVEFTVPSLPRGDYSVYGSDTIATSPSVIFRINPLIAISPQEGAVGSQVQINGTGFAASSGITIYWDAQVLTSNVVTSGSGSFTTSINVPSTTRGTHQISARDSGLGNSTASFVVNPAIRVNPTNGPPGTVVGITGTGFRSNASVRITYGGASVATQPTSISTDTQGNFSATFTVPSIVSGSYIVSASDGVYSATTTFGVAATVTISPTTGNVGTEILVSGTGFTPGGRVSVSYDSQAIITVTTGNSGAFSVSFNAPISQAGPHTVMARDLNTQNVSASATFTMEATPPPVPSLLTPQYDSLTDTLPLFTWSPVTDASGVTYDLQVARDASFAQLVLFKQGLTQPQYLVDPAERLALAKQSNPYYWRVRAVDRAVNIGDWASAGSFYTQDSTSPPVPALFGPASDSLVSPQPQFTWSSASDPAGVTYELQVARNDTFTQLVLSKQGLTQPQYQVSSSEALQLTKRSAPYYWRVRAIDGANNVSDWVAASSFYTQDSTAPSAPSPLSPEDGARAPSRVSFDWTDATDPSGVTYTLQAAQDTEFTHLVVLKEGLETSEYELTDMEKLSVSTGDPATPYYWRVRAVDGAQNVSDWSTVNSFYVRGFELRGWTLYAFIIIGAALLIAGGVLIGMRFRPGGGAGED